MTLFVAFTAAEATAGAGFASAIGDSFDILLLTGEPADGTGAANEILLGLAELPPADALANEIVARAPAYSTLGAVSSMTSKDVMARVAGLLDAGMVTDAIGVAGPNRYNRPVFAGSIIATVEVTGSPTVVTFRPAGFPSTSPLSAGRRTSAAFAGAGTAKRLSSSGRKIGRPDLAQAKRVVSGGKPLKDAQTFENLIGGLADVLGGAVGATRAAVDGGIAPNDAQVGQTGKVVAPELYIAAGISGSTQHVAGIKDSKVIVAINKDPDAPIFEVADFGLVADLFEAVPEMIGKLKA